MDAVLKKKCQWWYWFGWMLASGLSGTRQLSQLPWSITSALLLATIFSMVFAAGTLQFDLIGESDYQKKEFSFFRGCTRGAILSIFISLLFWLIRAIFT